MGKRFLLAIIGIVLITAGILLVRDSSDHPSKASDLPTVTVPIDTAPPTVPTTNALPTTTVVRSNCKQSHVTVANVKHAQGKNLRLTGTSCFTADTSVAYFDADNRGHRYFLDDMLQMPVGDMQPWGYTDYDVYDPSSTDFVVVAVQPACQAAIDKAKAEFPDEPSLTEDEFKPCAVLSTHPLAVAN